jgi:hypothetical protein
MPANLGAVMVSSLIREIQVWSAQNFDARPTLGVAVAVILVGGLYGNRLAESRDSGWAV